MAFQSILQAGTAVLVDKDGVPWPAAAAATRCSSRSSSRRPSASAARPTTSRRPRASTTTTTTPSTTATATATGSGSTFGSDFVDVCYLPYPDPPTVKRRPAFPRRTPPPTQQATNPSASFSPASGTADDTYTLSVSGFRPNATLTISLTRPDGVGETYSLTTNGERQRLVHLPARVRRGARHLHRDRDRPEHRRQRIGEHHGQRGPRGAAPAPQQDQGLNCERPAVAARVRAVPRRGAAPRAAASPRRTRTTTAPTSRPPARARTTCETAPD